MPGIGDCPGGHPVATKGPARHRGTQLRPHRRIVRHEAPRKPLYRNALGWGRPFPGNRDSRVAVFWPGWPFAAAARHVRFGIASNAPPRAGRSPIALVSPVWVPLPERQLPVRHRPGTARAETPTRSKVRLRAIWRAAPAPASRPVSLPGFPLPADGQPGWLASNSVAPTRMQPRLRRLNPFRLLQRGPGPSRKSLPSYGWR